MNKMNRVAGKVGKVTLALVTGIFFPVLIWVALGVAVTKILHEKRLQRVPTPTTAPL